MRCLATILLLTALSAPALAQTDGPPAAPVLKPVVTVSSDIVRIGDLVENAGAVAGVPVFRAPDLGSIGLVATSRVLEAIRPHKLTGVATNGLTEIAVTRASRAIGLKEIEARIARAVAARHGAGAADSLSITFDREVRTMHFDPSAGELQVVRFYYDPRSTRFDIAFEVPNGSRRTPLRFSGTAVETIQVAVLAQPAGRGEVVKPSDIAFERRPKNDVSADAVTDAEQAVGLALRRPLRAGTPLRQGDLMKPELVVRNEMVTLVYEVPGITLTMRGKALETGSAGDVVSVLNVQSKRTVHGTVSGQGRVTVAAATARIASRSSSTSGGSQPPARTE